MGFDKKLISLEDLYVKKEQDICQIFAQNFSSWKQFNEASVLVRTNRCPDHLFYISFDTKKRNTIPLIETSDGNRRIVDVSNRSKRLYEDLKQYKDSQYAYVETIREIC